MNDKEQSSKKSIIFVNNNLSEDNFNKTVKISNESKCCFLSTHTNKDEKTVLLEKGNYVGFEKKKPKEEYVNINETTTDNPKEYFQNIEKTTQIKKISTSGSSKRKRLNLCHNKESDRRSRKSNSKKAKEPIRLKPRNVSLSPCIEFSISSQSYYHGLRPIKDFENYFINPGDFLVHYAQLENEYKYYLVVMDNEKRIEVHTIENENGRYFLTSVKKMYKNAPNFKCIPQLVDHYRRHHISPKLFLKCKLKKPSHYIHHSAFSYDEKYGILGQGNFASVFKGTLNYKEYNDQVIAAKIFSLWNKNETIESRTEKLLQIIGEAKAMKNCNNQHVVKFYGIALNKFPITIIMELCSGGSLENHLKIEKENISLAERLFYCNDILNGACYLSSRNIVHRDLAARNILISDDGYLKIGDFGQAIQFNQHYSYIPKLKNKVVSLWSPPECLSHDSIAWNEKSDVWSFGILSIEIFNYGQPPFKNDDAINVVSQLKKGIYFEIPNLCHRDWSLVLKEGVFIKEQSNRFSFQQLKELLKALLTYDGNLSIPKSENIALNRRGVRRVEFKVPGKNCNNAKT